MADTSELIALAGVGVSFVMSAAALGVSIILGNRSAAAATASANEARRAADAAEEQAEEVKRANDLVEQARRRGVRAPDATTESARAVGWEIERGTRPNLVRLRNVGEAAATNVTIAPVSLRLLVGQGSGGPTVEPHGAVDVGLMGDAEHATPTVALVSWDGVVAPVSVPIPPE